MKDENNKDQSAMEEDYLSDFLGGTDKQDDIEDEVTPNGINTKEETKEEHDFFDDLGFAELDDVFSDEGITFDAGNTSGNADEEKGVGNERIMNESGAEIAGGLFADTDRSDNIPNDLNGFTSKEDKKSKKEEKPKKEKKPKKFNFFKRDNKEEQKASASDNGEQTGNQMEKDAIGVQSGENESDDFSDLAAMLGGGTGEEEYEGLNEDNESSEVQDSPNGKKAKKKKVKEKKVKEKKVKEKKDKKGLFGFGRKNEPVETKQEDQEISAEMPPEDNIIALDESPFDQDLGFNFDEVSEENLKIVEEEFDSLDDIEDRGGEDLKKAEKKRLKKEQKEQKAKEKAEIKEQKERAKKAKKDEKASIRKEKQEERAKEKKNDVTIKVTIPGIILFATSISFVVIAVTAGSTWATYSSKIDQAEEFFYNQRYKEAYDTISSISVRDNEDEQLLYDQITTVIQIEKQYQSYLNFKKLDMKGKALNALVIGLDKYDAFHDIGIEKGVLRDMNVVLDKIKGSLKLQFNLSEKKARALLKINDPDRYSEEIRDIVKNVKWKDE